MSFSHSDDNTFMFSPDMDNLEQMLEDVNFFSPSEEAQDPNCDNHTVIFSDGRTNVPHVYILFTDSNDTSRDTTICYQLDGLLTWIEATNISYAGNNYYWLPTDQWSQGNEIQLSGKTLVKNLQMVSFLYGMTYTFTAELQGYELVDGIEIPAYELDRAYRDLDINVSSITATAAGWY
jgi:hypothetical protein